MKNEKNKNQVLRKFNPVARGRLGWLKALLRRTVSFEKKTEIMSFWKYKIYSFSKKKSGFMGKVAFRYFCELKLFIITNHFPMGKK